MRMDCVFSPYFGNAKSSFLFSELLLANSSGSGKAKRQGVTVYKLDPTTGVWPLSGDDPWGMRTRIKGNQRAEEGRVSAELDGSEERCCRVRAPGSCGKRSDKRSIIS
ncbi:Elafin [Manis javanica]|nr:Elafin [Manis javanica]